MSVDPKHVFLVSGQRKLDPAVEQFVVIAPDDRAAYQRLAEIDPSFNPIGHATLHDYDHAASKLRATLAGESTGWKLAAAA